DKQDRAEDAEFDDGHDGASSLISMLTRPAAMARRISPSLTRPSSRARPAGREYEGIVSTSFLSIAAQASASVTVSPVPSTVRPRTTMRTCAPPATFRYQGESVDIKIRSPSRT